MRKNIILLFVILIIIIVGVLIYRQPNGSEKNQYDMIYCSGHSATVNEIKILDGEVMEPEREGHLASEAYDYQCYLLDTDSLIEEEIIIQELNNLGLIVFKDSLDGLRIVREELISQVDMDGGLIFYKVFLDNGSTKRLIYNEEYPVMIFRLIGWIAGQK